MGTTIIYKGVELDIEYDFQPFERRTHEHPGCEAHIEQITEITHKGTNFYEVFENDHDEIIEIINEQIL